MALRLLEQVLADIGRGRLVQIPQEEELATWEPALSQPPIYRPDLLMLGAGYIGGFTVVRERSALVSRSRIVTKTTSARRSNPSMQVTYQ